MHTVWKRLIENIWGVSILSEIIKIHSIPLKAIPEVLTWCILMNENQRWHLHYGTGCFCLFSTLWTLFLTVFTEMREGVTVQDVPRLSIADQNHLIVQSRWRLTEENALTETRPVCCTHRCFAVQTGLALMSRVTGSVTFEKLNINNFYTSLIKIRVDFVCLVEVLCSEEEYKQFKS